MNIQIPVRPVRGYRNKHAVTGRRWAEHVRQMLWLVHRILVEPTSPPTRITRDAQVIFVANPWLDLAGCDGHGRMVVVECKVTAGKRLKIGVGGLTPSQYRSMARWADQGAIVWLAWRAENVGRLISFEDLRQYYLDERVNHLEFEWFDGACSI